MEKEISLLSRLAIKYETDKWNHHWYTEHYFFHLQHLRHETFNMLEIGVGGYEYPDRGGQSLRMWKDFFHYAQVHAIDIYDKSALQEDRIIIHKGSQTDRQFLSEVYNRMNGDNKLMLIVDDGSHDNAHIITSFMELWPKLADGGIYIIEDTETSYWPDYGGSPNLLRPYTTVNFFKDFIHGQMHGCIPDYPVTDFNHTIEGISFYKGCIILKKGGNR